MLGRTAAGLTAACRLARAGRRVVVAECSTDLAESPLADWLAADVLGREPALKGAIKAAGGEAFSEIRFYSSDGQRTARHAGRKTLGYFLPAGGLIEALAAAARHAGATFAQPSDLSDIRLQEDSVTLAGRPPSAARVLLVACSRPDEVTGWLNMPGGNVPRGTLTVVGMDATVPGSAVARHLGKALHVVHLSRDGDLVLAFAAGHAVHVRLVQPAAHGLSVEEAAAMLPEALQQAGVLPEALPAGAVRTALWAPPDAVALDLEDHVAKRALLIGTAGGFADRVTGQTLGPSIRSAVLAADVVDRSLPTADVQAALNTFNTVWRGELADALRPPHTAVGMLLPLLFANKQMVTRFAGAMLHGGSI